MAVRFSKKLAGILVILVLLLGLVYAVNSWYSSYTSLFSRNLPSKAVVDVGGERIDVEAYVPTDPLQVINHTVYHRYSSAVVFVGTSSTRDYCDKTGKCQLRTMAAAEVSCLVGKVFGAYYYETAREVGYNDTDARRFAVEKVSEVVRAGEWVSFSDKLEIGRGKIGNGDTLLILLRGPLDGAEKNRIYVPREGVIVLEAMSDDALYKEALLLEEILGIKCSK